MSDPTAKPQDNGPGKSLTIVICPRCGALISEELKAKHNEWHEQLRQIGMPE
jgi:hypothetical protein